MSDAEESYRRALSRVLGAANLMCCFHVKQARKDCLAKRSAGTAEQKAAQWASVSADMDALRCAANHADFRSRCEAVEKKWQQDGLGADTAWTGKDGISRNFVSYFLQQWGPSGLAPEWYFGALAGNSDAAVETAPGTNNGAESCIKNIRKAACGLDQVRTVSLDVLDPRAARRVDDVTRSKAVAFETLFGAARIARVEGHSVSLYCCLPRGGPKDADVRNREAMPRDLARESCKAFAAKCRGEPTTPEKLALFAGRDASRVFGIDHGKAFCTCALFPSLKMCFHSIGPQVHTGALTAPPRLNAIHLPAANPAVPTLSENAKTRN
ncbi:unnamed protein product, partial [Prorocentrum cordatum]